MELSGPEEPSPMAKQATWKSVPSWKTTQYCLRNQGTNAHLASNAYLTPGVLGATPPASWQIGRPGPRTSDDHRHEPP